MVENNYNKEKIKVLHFSTLDFGGAAAAAYRFHKNLNNSGFESKMIVSKKTIDDSSILEIRKNRFFSFPYDILTKLENRFNLFNEKYYFFDRMRYNRINLKSLEKAMEFEPDIVILHWITNFIDLDLVKKMKKKKSRLKIYWYLMDMSPMTGGCHYAWKCDGYKKNCEKCPAVSFLYKNLPIKNLKYKKDLVRDIGIKSLVASSWLMNQLKSSSIFKNQINTELLLGINKEIFKPKDKNEIRNRYNLPKNKRVIFFGASNVKEERKGFFYILEALSLIVNESKDYLSKIIVVTAGNLENEEDVKKIGFEHRHFGFLKTDFELAEMYQMSDLFISASIEDSGPMMINESIMSGTPVVSFNMGVASDLILNGKTGYLAQLKSADELKNGILSIVDLRNEDIEIISKNCREIALSKISFEAQIENFFKIISNYK